MKRISFEIHYVDGMNEEYLSQSILIRKPKISVVFSFDEEDLEILGIQCIRQLIHHIKTVNHCVESLIDVSGMDNFSVQTTYIKQKDYLLCLEDDKTLDQVFLDFQTEHLTFLLFFVGGGGSIECNGYRFAVHSDEKIHEHMPHVHVIKGKESVRYSLVTLKRIDNCSHVFLRDEKKIILPALKKYLPRLQEFWTAAMGGYRPPEFDFDNKQYYPES